MTDLSAPTKVREAIHRCLAASPKGREPMNALVVWTELGKGLAGTLEEVGVGRGMLRNIIVAHCMDRGAAPDVDLERWAYRVEPEERLTAAETAAVLQHTEAELAQALPELARRSEGSPETRRRLFVTVAQGWYPVGLDIVRTLPAARQAPESALLGALAAWCARYLPESASGADFTPLADTEAQELLAFLGKTEDNNDAHEESGT
ncbi:MAG: hypothetical protein B6D46_13695 [Polyangiaceae bacterium UTPRO1]|jgi:hypothetical protein|nr:hypothetical protein [Myxococcales bacterium]OQY65753.1 MAG: hypothetical protein B6D46_13695 [Polyangiaceae bacterium UTPRO1]